MEHDESVHEILEWFMTGECGMSSEALAFETLGANVRGRKLAYPGDPSDLRRCVQLAERVPSVLTVGLPRLAAKSWQWRAIAENWDVLVRTLERETEQPTLADDGTPLAVETWRLMCALLGKSRREKAA